LQLRKIRNPTVTMKFIVVVFVLAQVGFLGSNGSPVTLPKPCHRSNPELSKCLSKFFYKTAHVLIKGSPEHHIPRLDPAEIEVFRINRTLNDFVTVNAVLKNIRVVGLGNFAINQVKVDPDNLSGEAWITHPNVSVAVDYNITARVQGNIYHNRGNFRGKFANIVTHIKLSVGETDRDGVKHFGINTVAADGTIGDGIIKIITKTRRDQLIADMVTSYFNSNPRRVLELINPFYVEYLNNGVEFALNRALEEFTAEQLLVE